MLYWFEVKESWDQGAIERTRVAARDLGAISLSGWERRLGGRGDYSASTE
jgi:hypothetical protein